MSAAIQTTEIAVQADTADDFLARMADPSIDAAKVKSMWEVQKDILATRARIEFYDDLPRAQAEFPVIGRDASNEQTKSRYARFETIWEMCCPIWVKYGFGIMFPSITTPEGLIRMSARVTHRGGHAEEIPWPDTAPDNAGTKGVVNKTMVQANQSTVSYLKRGLLCAAFGIVTRYEDDDGNGGAKDTRRSSWRSAEGEDADRAEAAEAERARKAREQQVPADWVEAVIAILKRPENENQETWFRSLQTCLAGAPSASEIIRLSKALFKAMVPPPPAPTSERIRRIFTEAMAALAVKDGPKGTASDKKSDTVSDTVPTLTDDEQWAEDEIERIQAINDMDTFLSVAKIPETQQRMKALSHNPKTRPLYKRVEAAYVQRQDHIAREAVR